MGVYAGDPIYPQRNQLEMERTIITINLPVVYMVRDVVIWMQANPLRVPFEGVGHENQDFLGP